QVLARVRGRAHELRRWHCAHGGRVSRECRRRRRLRKSSLTLLMEDTVSRNELGRLHDFAVFLGAEEDLHAHLAELAERAASVTDAASCSLMLLSEVGDAAPRLRLWCSTGAPPG